MKLENMTLEEALHQIDEMHEKIGRMRKTINVLLKKQIELKKAVRTLHRRYVELRGWE